MRETGALGAVTGGPDENRGELRVSLITTGVTATLFALASPVQMFLVLTQGDRWLEHPDQTAFSDLPERIVVNLAAVVLLLVLVVAMQVYRRGALGRALTSVLISAIVSGLRLPLQGLMGVYPGSEPYRYIVDGLSVFFVVLTSILLGLAQADSRRRLRMQERTATEQRLRASAALDSLQADALRLRREVADSLHGTVQHQFVLIGAWLAALRPRLTPVDTVQLDRIMDELDRVRESEVRQLSHSLYPTGMEQGVGVAVRGLLRRLPESIHTTLEVDTAFQRFDTGVNSDALPQGTKVLLVRIAEEAVTNALRHGKASEIKVSFGIGDGSALLLVEDNGVGPAPAGEREGGIAALREHADAIGGHLRLDAGERAGATLSARIPLGSTLLS